MSFTIHALDTNPIARLLARLIRHCTVTLSTGLKLEFDKGRHCDIGCCSYERPMSKLEEQEFIHAMMLMGI